MDRSVLLLPIDRSDFQEADKVERRSAASIQQRLDDLGRQQCQLQQPPHIPLVQALSLARVLKRVLLEALGAAEQQPGHAVQQAPAAQRAPGGYPSGEGRG